MEKFTDSVSTFQATHTSANYDQHLTISGDLNNFQNQLRELEENLIRQQIQTYKKGSSQKQFPSLLKQLKHRSDSLLKLQKQVNFFHEKCESEVSNHSSEISLFQREIQNLQENHLYTLEQQNLKFSYEKELLIGMLDSFQLRATQLNEEKLKMNTEKDQLSQKRQYLQSYIRQEKQKIVKLSIQRHNLLEELNFTKKCQLQPIHMLYQKNFQSFKSTADHFFIRFAPEYNTENNLPLTTVCSSSGGQSIIHKLCEQYDQLTRQQFKKQMNPSQNLDEDFYVQEFTFQKRKMGKLQRKLKDLTHKKLAISNELSVQLTKSKDMHQQISIKQQNILKNAQLLKYVEAYPFTIQLLSSNRSTTENNFFETQVVSIQKLEKKVQDQLIKNTQLKTKLGLLFQKMQTCKLTNQNLTHLLIHQEKQHNQTTKNLLAENNFLKTNLEKKKIFYQDKNETISSQHKSVLKSNFQTKKQIFTKKDTNIFLNPIQKDASSPNLAIKHVQTEKFTGKGAQNLNSSLKQLRKRLQAKFFSQSLKK